MGIQELVEDLNCYRKWQMRDPAAREIREKAFQAVLALVEAFERASPEERAAAAASLGDSAKGVMFHFTWTKAAEARRTGSKEALTQGLLPVVIAGGRSETATGGMLLAILLRSAEVMGLDAREIFARRELWR